MYEHDLPESWVTTPGIRILSVDTETTGLQLGRDRLCLAQFRDGNGQVAIVRFQDAVYDKSKNIKQLLSDEKIPKIFHFARFDTGILYKTFKTVTKNIICTRVLSKLCRTYSNKHGIKEVCKELLQIEMDKTEGTSYWGGETLSESQIKYAVSDVLYLEKLYLALKAMAERENKMFIAERVFSIIGEIIKMDCAGIDSTEFLELM